MIYQSHNEWGLQKSDQLHKMGKGDTLLNKYAFNLLFILPHKKNVCNICELESWLKYMQVDIHKTVILYAFQTCSYMQYMHVSL